MDVSPPPQGDDPIITQFKPAWNQWELTDENIKRMDPQTGQTILHNYCQHINTTPLEVYRYLIETKGCDVNARDNLNRNPIYPAFLYLNPNKGGDITVLMYLLNQENVNGNIKDKCGYTLLHYACQQINSLPIEIFKFLIETKGCDVNALNNYNQTSIHLASHCFHPTHGGNITVLAYLFSQKGIDGNIKDSYGCTLLHYACKYINIPPLEIFQHLIQKNGCDINAQNDSKDTPLHLAFHGFDPNEGGDITVLHYLLDQTNVDVNIKGKYGNTLLHGACGRINHLPLDVFKFLIETMGCDVNAEDNNKDTPLHNALRYFNPNEGGDITVLTYLLSQKGIDVNIKGQNGYTLLHIAFDRMNKFPLDVFKLLIETHGCDINVVIEARPCLFHIALRHFNGDSTALAYLLRQGAVKINIKDLNFHTLLHYACESINKLSLDVFKVLIETMGYDVNAQDKNNCTPLHNALRYFNPNEGGDITVLHYLLSQKGIDGNIKDKFGYTLLHWACGRINTLPIDVFRLLIETHGADVNVQHKNKDTPLHDALFYFDPNNGGDISVLEYLFNQTKVHVNIKDKDGYTLLHYACDMIKDCPLDVFKFLIETMGYDVNAQDNNKDTPLHNAIRCFGPRNSGNITVLTYLINQKAVNVDIKGKDGYTLLHIACEKIHDLPLDIFKLLIETHGGDVNVQDTNNDTPLHCALRYFKQDNGGNTKVLTYLINQQTVNVNINGKKGHTILHLACINNLSKSKSFIKLNAKADTNLCRIVEVIAERCVQQVLDENNLK